MKTLNKRPRKLMRPRNKKRVNRERKQHFVFCPLFILVLIKLALEKDNTADKLLTRLRKHIQMLTGNASFPVTDPTVAEVQILADALEAAIDAVNAGIKSQIPVRLGLEEDAREMIRQLSYHIQYLSKGDAEKILSSGYEVRLQGGPKPGPGQVQHLTARAVGGGKVKLRWDKDDGSLMYIIERSQNPLVATSWTLVKKVKRITYTVEGLIPGQVYYFRVYGTGTEDGLPSDMAEQRVL